MEFKLDKQYKVAASVDTAWQLLTNIPEVAGCMPGAQISEQLDATHYKGNVRVKVGPAVAAFAGDIEVLALDPATRTLRMLGKGADKGGSSASMDLTAMVTAAEEGGSTLNGQAKVIVNGKFAQFGGRMMVSVSDVLLGQFAATFAQKAGALEDARVSAGSAPASTGSAEPASATAASPSDAPPLPAPRAAAAAARELNLLALAWAMLRGWISRLFGRKA
jgi:carbon monoxide dehydrogenase subunit G